MRRIAFFEDAAAEQLRPLTLLRPVFELLCGHFTVRERWVRFGGVQEWGAWLRPELAATYAEQHPEARLNDANWMAGGATTLINGRWLPAAGAMPVLAPNTAAYIGDTLVAVTLASGEA